MTTPNDICDTCEKEKCMTWNKPGEHGSCAWPSVCHGGHSPKKPEAVEAEKEDDAPMGVSQWREHGIKYGYDKFFGLHLDKCVPHKITLPCYYCSTGKPDTTAEAEKEGWRERFEGRFLLKEFGVKDLDMAHTCKSFDCIKDFIERELASARLAALKEALGVVEKAQEDYVGEEGDYPWDGFKEAVSAIDRLIQQES